MNPIYFIVALIVAFMLCTCAEAQQETIPLFGPVEISSYVLANGDGLPYAYSSPAPDPGLFPSAYAGPNGNTINLPIPTGNALLDFIQTAIMAFFAWKFRRARMSEPQFDTRDYVPKQ